MSSMQFTVYDVAAEFLMDVTKTIVSSPYPMTKEDLLRSFHKSSTYVNNAIYQCVQLGLINAQGTEYTGSEPYRALILRSNRSQLVIPLKQVLQRYPPYILYLDFICKGYSSDESVNMVRGIFRIQSPEDVVSKSFKNWGLTTSLILKDKSGNLSVSEITQGLPSEYIANLLKALQADLHARIFIIETMSQQVFVYLTEKGIDIDNLSKALMSFESDPKGAANKASQTYEHYLYAIGSDSDIAVGECNGVIELSDPIRKQNIILKNQWHINHGIGALRNMSHHNPDKETGKPWTFTPQGAIITTLLVPTMMRSTYLYWKEKKQEF